MDFCLPTLKKWLNKILQPLKIFISSEIEKGDRGLDRITDALETHNYGLVCLTSDNLESKWVHFESGAISKVPNSRVFTLLYEIEILDVKEPLAQFQHTKFDKNDVKKLLKQMNKTLVDEHLSNLDDKGLEEMVDSLWEELVTKIQESVSSLPAEPSNPDSSAENNTNTQNEALNEILVNIRGLYDKHSQTEDKISDIETQLKGLSLNLANNSVSVRQPDDIRDTRYIKSMRVNYYSMNNLTQEVVEKYIKSVLPETTDVVLTHAAARTITASFNKNPYSASLIKDALSSLLGAPGDIFLYYSDGSISR